MLRTYNINSRRTHNEYVDVDRKYRHSSDSSTSGRNQSGNSLIQTPVEDNPMFEETNKIKTRTVS